MLTLHTYIHTQKEEILQGQRGQLYINPVENTDFPISFLFARRNMSNNEIVRTDWPSLIRGTGYVLFGFVFPLLGNFLC